MPRKKQLIRNTTTGREKHVSLKDWETISKSPYMKAWQLVEPLEKPNIELKAETKADKSDDNTPRESESIQSD